MEAWQIDYSETAAITRLRITLRHGYPGREANAAQPFWSKMLFFPIFHDEHHDRSFQGPHF
jgi:hypothetical protein